MPQLTAATKTKALANLQIETLLKNIGKSVAQNVFVWAELFVYPVRNGDEQVIEREQSAFCSQWRGKSSIPPPANISWSAVFPDARISYKAGVAAYLTEQNLSRVSGKSGDYFAAVLIGCVTYQYPRNYQTQVRYDLLGKTDRLLKVGVPLDTTQLRLIRSQHTEYAQ